MSLRVRTELYVRMRDFALKANATHNALVEAALEFYLDHVQVVIKMPTRTEMTASISIIRDTK